MLTVRRVVGKEYWGNCWFLIFKLWLTNRLVEVITTKSACQPWKPRHSLGITLRGHVVHFKASNKRAKCSYWLKGRVEVIRGSAWKSK